MHGEAAGLEVGAHHLGQLDGVRHVGLVEHHDARTLGERAAAQRLVDRVRRELGLDDVEVAQRVAARLERGAVDDVHEHRAALDVAQELQAQPLALAGAGDQPGDVGHGEPHVTGLHDAEVGHEGGERVVGDLGAGRRHRCHEAGLAGAGVAHERDVGERLELEHDVAGVARLTEQREAGRLAPGRGQRRVAEATAAAARQHEARARAHEVGEHLAVRRLHDRAVRHGQHDVLAVGAVAVRALAGLAAGGLAVRAVVVVEQRGGVGVDDEHDVAAATAVAAVRAAERLELLAVHRRAAVATVTSGDVQHDVVDERRHGDLLREVGWLGHESRGWAVTGPPPRRGSVCCGPLRPAGRR